MNTNFIQQLAQSHTGAPALPPSSAICEFANEILGILFPEFANRKLGSEELVNEALSKCQNDLEKILETLKSFNPQLDSKYICKNFFERLSLINSYLKTDIEAILTGDPAAQNESEIIRAYPGFFAIAYYRIAHQLFDLQVPVMPRIITSFAHNHTGIDIHPGAEIGNYFCIDHGTGIVIGGTTHIGKYVKLYQGVTLGALSVDKSMASLKRHPTIEDHVVIYAGATILGGDTVVGNHSVIGGNAWLTRGVPAYSVVYNKPQIEVRQAGTRSDIPS